MERCTNHRKGAQAYLFHFKMELEAIWWLYLPTVHRNGTPTSIGNNLCIPIAIFLPANKFSCDIKHPGLDSLFNASQIYKATLTPSHTFRLNCYSASPVAQSWLMSCWTELVTIIKVHPCSYKCISVSLEAARPERVVRALMLRSEMEEGSKAAQEPASQPASSSHTARFMETIPSKELSFFNDL